MTITEIHAQAGVSWNAPRGRHYRLSVRLVAEVQPGEETDKCARDLQQVAHSLVHTERKRIQGNVDREERRIREESVTAPGVLQELVPAIEAGAEADELRRSTHADGETPATEVAAPEVAR